MSASCSGDQLGRVAFGADVAFARPAIDEALETRGAAGHARLTAALER